MKNIFESFTLEIKMILKSKLTWVLLIAYDIYISIVPWVSMSESIGGSLTRNALAVEAGMFLFLVLGFNMVKEEEKYLCEELFYSMKGGKVPKICGKILTILVSAAVVSTLTTLTYYAFFIAYEVPLVFYIKGALYIVLYYTLPFMITGILGMIIGQHAKGKGAYILLLFTWLLLGLGNIVLFYPVLHFVKDGFDRAADVATFLNLAQNSPSIPFNNVYGLPMELTWWYKRLLFLWVVLHAFIGLTLAKSNRRNIKRILFTAASCILISVPLTLLYLKPAQVLYFGDEKYSTRDYDLKYYFSKHSDTAAKDDNFQVEKYDIDLKCYRVITVDLDMVIKSHEDLETLSFTLYRDLKVSNVEANGEKLRFTQIGDSLRVELATILKANSKLNLTFHYQGKTSPYFFANEQAVMLPAYYAWLPREGTFQLMDGESGYCSKPFKEASYTLRYAGPMPLYTNLASKGKNLWEGSAKDGITLAASAFLKHETYEGMEIVYSQELFRDKDSIFKNLKLEKEIRRRIGEDLNISTSSEAFRMVFLLPPPSSGNVAISSHEFLDHMIIESYAVYKNPDAALMAVSNFKSITGSDKPDYCVNNEITPDVIASGYQYWYALRYEPQLINRCWLSGRLDPRQNYFEAVKAMKRLIEENRDNKEFLEEFFNKGIQYAKEKDLEAFKVLVGL